MRYFDSGSTAAHEAAADQGLIIRKLVSIYARTLDGASVVPYHFWSGAVTATMSVIEPSTGMTDARTYLAGGSLIDIDDIPYSADLNVQTVTVTLSHIHAVVNDMLRGHDVRSAIAQIHRAEFDPGTRDLVGPPYCLFYGKIDKAPVSTPEAGQEGGIKVDVEGYTRELTRFNPAKKSDAQHRERDPDDAFRKDVGTAAVKFWWGQKAEKDKAKAKIPFLPWL